MADLIPEQEAEVARIVANGFSEERAVQTEIPARPASQARRQ